MLTHEHLHVADELGDFAVPVNAQLVGMYDNITVGKLDIAFDIEPFGSADSQTIVFNHGLFDISGGRRRE